MEEKTKIKITISEILLKNIKKNIEGKTVDDKFEFCIRKGYKILTT